MYFFIIIYNLLPISFSISMNMIVISQIRVFSKCKMSNDMICYRQSLVSVSNMIASQFLLFVAERCSQILVLEDAIFISSIIRLLVVSTIQLCFLVVRIQFLYQI